MQLYISSIVYQFSVTSRKLMHSLASRYSLWSAAPWHLWKQAEQFKRRPFRVHFSRLEMSCTRSLFKKMEFHRLVCWAALFLLRWIPWELHCLAQFLTHYILTMFTLPWNHVICPFLRGISNWLQTNLQNEQMKMVCFNPDKSTCVGGFL